MVSLQVQKFQIKVHFPLILFTKWWKLQRVITSIHELTHATRAISASQRI